MHIVYIIAGEGGPEAYVKTLLPWFEKNQIRISIVSLGEIRGFPQRVEVLNARPSSLHYYLSKIPVLRKKSLSIRALEQEFSVWRQLKKIHRKTPIDVVEVTEGLPLAILPRFWKVIVRAHGSDWTFWHFCKDEKADIQTGVKMERSQLLRASAVSPLSQHLADHLSEFCAIPRGKFDVIPYAIDTNIFCPAAEEPQEPTLLVVGRLEKRKGTDTLFRAMNKIWMAFPAMKLCVLGGEKDCKKADLLEMIPAEKRSQVTFPGFISREELPAYYQKTSLYVAPTQYETFGYTILEAMACGLPVVSCFTGAVPELIEENVHGHLVSYGDAEMLAAAIISLFADDATRKKMGQNSRKKSLEYSLEIVGKKISNLYQTVAAP